MRLEQAFEIEAPLAEVWSALIDVERVAPCLPGAEITEVGEEGTFRGSFRVKLGPTTAAYRGELAMESLDEQRHVAAMRASGQDRRGQGGARATIVSTLSEAGGGTRVDVITDFAITGRLARFGRGGMIEDVSRRLLREFAECLQRDIERGASAGPERGVPAAPGQREVTASAACGAAKHEPPRPSPPPPQAGTVPAKRPTAPPRRESAQAPSAKPLRGISILFSVLRERLKRRLGRSR